MKTLIKATQDLFNAGQCFTKDETYEVDGHVTMEASLMDKQVINDLGEKHNIGSWWRNFEIIDNA